MLKYLLAHLFFYLFVHQTHKTPTLKEELPSYPSASSHLPVKLESLGGEELMNKQKKSKVKTERMKMPSGWKCLSCDTQYTEREDYIAHMSEQHGKVGCSLQSDTDLPFGFTDRYS